jgi:hypothetical protein
LEINLEKREDYIKISATSISIAILLPTLSFVALMLKAEIGGFVFHWTVGSIEWLDGSDF